MDQNLQARLIGATVLVALAVLLIPELLSGRRTVEPAVEDGAAARGTRSFTIELTAPGGQMEVPPAAASSAVAPAARPPVVPDEGSTTPEAAHRSGAGPEPPAADERSDDAQPAAPGPTQASSQPTPSAAAPQAPSPSPGAATTGGWVVQVGAFSSDAGARRLVDELGSAGFEAQVAPVTRSGRTLHRVRVGPPGGRPAAEQLAQRLKARGLPATVVEND
jgi:DedD protein